MKTGKTLMEVANELERQLIAKKDMLVPSELMRCQTDAAGNCSLAILEGKDVANVYPMSDVARKQIAEKLKIPYGYFERMRTEQPDLLDSNTNAWLGREENVKRMVRVLDDKVRAVLSRRYRRLDNFDLAESILPVLGGLPGARFESVELTETRLYLKVVCPKVEYQVAPGDVVQAGVVVSNSEVGCGKLSVQPLIFRLVCSNGLIMSDRAMRRTHLGRMLGDADVDVTVFKDDTLQADDKAIFLKVRDMVENAVSQVTFRMISEKMQKTLGIKLLGDPVKSVEVLANHLGMDDEERAGVLRQLIIGSDLSGYGLINAVTGYSQEVANYDRATELEEFGGKMLDFTTSDWRQVAEPA